MEDEDVLRILQQATRQTRDYADYWEWEIDRARAERGVAEALRDFLHIQGDVISPASDPPDVLLSTSCGRRIGIEVTELLEGRAAAQNRGALQTGQQQRVIAIWTVGTVVTEIERLVAVKDQKLSRVVDVFDELWLAVATDEPTIDIAMAEAACSGNRASAQHISRTFLLLGYHPDALPRFPSGCAVFPVPMR